MTYVRKENPLPSHIQPIGVIQGHSVSRVDLFAARALEDMGYERFAVGSLAALVQNTQDEALRRIDAALEAVGSNLHVLGVSTRYAAPEALKARRAIS